jgi:hypothetical protein
MGKLKEMPLEAEIPAAIKSDVLDNLVPEYEKQREKETLKDRVSILSISLLIVNSVFENIFGYLFYPIQWFGNAVLGLLLVFSLIQLAKPQINEFDADIQKILREGVRTSYFIAYIVLLLVGIMFLFLGILFTFNTLNHNSTLQEVQISIALVIGGALLLIGGGVLAYTSLRKSRIKLH